MLLLHISNTAGKMSKDGVFCGPYFPAFGLNTDIYEVNLRVQSRYGKRQTAKNSVFGLSSRSAIRVNLVFEKFNNNVAPFTWKSRTFR